ncbi:hypothetical protein AXI64_gp049 [Vibrio phage qdvp001]|uniref:hypothetical protein n=1 Tax=Vibrio phage qdvp001 TaxID=1003177 RepID=UPI000720A094|nr:hypothetical protein AXI64_gp049 [Vibrio phage qdvp001]ALM62041.1 hypothetical protein qdvp001_049 [Vibrio phage qdvp001]
MNTVSITEKEFRYWQAEITRKGFHIFNEKRSYNENCIDYFIEATPTERTYILSKQTNGVGKVMYYNNADIIGGVE